MTTQGQSVWLGSARRPVRLAMIGFVGVLAILIVGQIAGALFFDTGFGMKEFLQPHEHTIVLVTEIVGALALLFTGLYFSDIRGAIEPEPDGFFDIVSLVCARIAMVAIASVVFVMFYEVVSRYVFDKPTLWANELSLWIAGFVFLLAGLYAMQQRSHIRIYIIYDIMPRWMRKTSDVVSVGLIWGFTFALIWGGYNEARDKFFRMETFGTAWDPPIPATVKPAILIIIAMVAIQALSNLIADWNKAPESHAPIEDIDETEIELIRRTLKD
ncbi:TRAP transporter small permease subunit [Bauldia sp.]|uniref:TRAP transporter small permease subunit n=1 Tax=Bauldia sp. TaxID=2575872 RepID=UPI003BA88F90